MIHLKVRKHPKNPEDRDADSVTLVAPLVRVLAVTETRSPEVRLILFNLLTLCLWPLLGNSAPRGCRFLPKEN